MLVRTSQSQNEEAMMIGYSFSSKGYKLWDPGLKKVIISRSVKFDEENISVDVNIEEHNTDGTDEVRTVPTIGIKSPVEFRSVDSQNS